MYTALSRSDAFFAGSDKKIDMIFGGVPRDCLPCEVNVGVLLFYFLDPFIALVLNDVIMRIAAFVGMVLLLHRHLMPHGKYALICGASLCFAFLPFYPAGYLGVAGQPLLVYAILNLRGGRKSLIDWLILIIFPLYSSLIYVGWWMLLILGGLILYDLARLRRLNVRLVAAFFLMSVLFAASEYRIIRQTFLAGDYTSQRTEFDKQGLSYRRALAAGLENFVLGHRHHAGVQLPVILFSVGLVTIVLLINGLRKERCALPRTIDWLFQDDADPAPSRSVAMLMTLLLCAALSLCMAVWRWQPTVDWVAGSRIAAVRHFNFSRITWFHPLLWTLAFAFCLDRIGRIRRLGRILPGILIVAQLGCAVRGGFGLPEVKRPPLTFRQFYSPELFREIQRYIDKPPENYRVVSVGMLPFIALYNGFCVLDGYMPNFPVEYKHGFRRVIAAELEKDDSLKKYYDAWGCRCYVFSAELGIRNGLANVYTKDHPKRSVEDLDIDTTALRELGCDYVLSAVEIKNHESLGLTFERTFERADSPWRVFLYSLEGGRDVAHNSLLSRLLLADAGTDREPHGPGKPELDNVFSRGHNDHPAPEPAARIRERDGRFGRGKGLRLFGPSAT